jgi:hypothetical protein
MYMLSWSLYPQDKGDAVVWKLEDPAVLAQEIAKKEAEILKKKLEKEENARKVIRLYYLCILQQMTLAVCD